MLSLPLRAIPAVTSIKLKIHGFKGRGNKHLFQIKKKKNSNLGGTDSGRSPNRWFYEETKLRRVSETEKGKVMSTAGRG